MSLPAILRQKPVSSTCVFNSQKNCCAVVPDRLVAAHKVFLVCIKHRINRHALDFFFLHAKCSDNYFSLSRSSGDNYTSMCKWDILHILINFYYINFSFSSFLVAMKPNIFTSNKKGLW